MCLSAYDALAQSSDLTTEAEARAAIKAVNDEIAALEQLITSQSKERDELQARLRDTDVAIGRANEALRKTQASLNQRQRQINELESYGLRLERRINDLKQTIETSIGVFSVLKQGGDLKIFFGDSTPQDTERNLAYFNLLLEQQFETIDEFKRVVSELDANRALLAAAQAEQEDDRATLSQTRASLVSQRAEQKTVISQLSASLARDGEQVTALRADSARLNTLLAELLERLASLSLDGEYDDFSSLKGKLRAPLDGASKTRFGQKRGRGDLRWQGWLIPADRGSSVRSVYFGRVIYADWLRGQGLLTIVDHGDGWMSLYGHNESLLKETGEWVAPGEVIARVGSSGGATEPALYFEIRSDGTPVNPVNWIR
ncbi:MAG: murein hydrolase activator EnvC family protein [Luminiphilus sp.]